MKWEFAYGKSLHCLRFLIFNSLSATFAGFKRAATVILGILFFFLVSGFKNLHVFFFNSTPLFYDLEVLVQRTQKEIPEPGFGLGLASKLKYRYNLNPKLYPDPLNLSPNSPKL